MDEFERRALIVSSASISQAYIMRVPRLSLLPVLAREIFGRREFPREPEPDLVMDDPEQVAAYSEAGRVDGTMSANYLFHSALITQTIQGCAQVLDLGCGPATQLGQVAALNPETVFTGVDLSTSMLQDAEKHVSALGLHNVRVQQDDITALRSIPDQSVDAVISTLALHHLPTHEHLRCCFGAIARVLRPGGALYLADFGRLKSLKSVLYFAYMNADRQPHIFSLDYERSLRASFEFADYQNFAPTLPAGVQVHSTFKVPFMIILKTAGRPMDKGLMSKLQTMRAALPARYRHDLEDLSLFFRLGGLPPHPFS